jgi:hypothetical protein
MSERSLDGKTTPPRIRRRHQNTEDTICFALFLFLSCLVVAAQNLSPSNFIYDGLFIPDVVAMSNVLDLVLTQDKALPLTLGTIPGVVALYMPAWMLHPALSVFINLALIYYSITLMREIFIKTGISSRLAYLGILCNPYLYLAVSGPNKEVPLTFLTLLIVRTVFFKRRWWMAKACLTSGCVFFFRDGYGAILLMMILLYAPFRKSPRRFVIAGVFLLLVATALTGVLAEYVWFIGRNKEGAELLQADVSSGMMAYGASFGGQNPIMNGVMLGVRSIYNLLTAAVFPQFLTTANSLYALGFAFWIFGLFIVAGIGACVAAVCKSGKAGTEKWRSGISAMVLFLWVALSVSLYVQPRYLMPILPISIGILASYGIIRCMQLGTLAIVGALAIIILYDFMGHPPVKLEVEPVAPSFLFVRD